MLVSLALELHSRQTMSDGVKCVFIRSLAQRRPAAMSLLQGSPGGKIDKLLNLSRLVLHQPVR